MSINLALQTNSTTSQSHDIRVLLVDDSLVVRSVLERMLGTRKEFTIANATASAQEAIEYLKAETVDVILLDIEMPHQNGLDALPEILEHCGDAKVMILSSNCEEGGPAAIKALSLGACDTLAKPGRSSFAGKFADILAERLIAVVNGGREQSQGTSTIKLVESEAEQKPDCIAIGASTGGIPAIQQILKQLPNQISAPIFITQHLPSSFIQFFAKQLSEITSRKVQVAEHGMPILRNNIYVSPGHKHMTCAQTGERKTIRLIEGKFTAGYTPSVDPLFASVAECYGKSAVGIMLSGMGRDGLEGATSLSSSGGLIIAQDMETSVVWGMPGAVARAGIANAILPSDKIARHLEGISKEMRA